MKYVLILVSFFLVSYSVNDHKDRILRIDENGIITGLPSDYGVCKFDIVKKYLKIKDKEVLMPECIGYYFEIHDNPTLDLSGSWYHSKKILPNYISFKISEPGKTDAYSLLFNLDTLELISIKVLIKKEKSTYMHSITKRDRCLEKYEKAIKEVKH